MNLYRNVAAVALIALALAIPAAAEGGGGSNGCADRGRGGRGSMRDDDLVTFQTRDGRG